MFSYLRPNHKRAPSNPSSPAEHSTFERPLHPNLPLDHGHPNRYQDTVDPKSSSASLPPIVRVSSVESHVEDWRTIGNEGEPRKQHWDALRNSTRPVDANTHSTHQRIPSFSANERPESAGKKGGQGYANSQYPRSPVGAGKDSMKSPGQQYGAADHQNRSTQNGRRATGVRMQTPPPSQQNQVSTFDPVPPKTSKTRLNLLNPMSLLARRRTSQAVPQLLSESLVSKKGSDTYDFQIKGKFVHDFSAPRVKRNISYDSRLHDNGNQQHFERSPNLTVTELNVPDEASVSPWSGGNHTPVFTENFDEEQYPAAGPHVRKAGDLTDLTLPQPPYAKGSRKPDDSISQPLSAEASHKLGSQTKPNDRKSNSDTGPKVPPKEENNVSNEKRRISVDPYSMRQISTASSNKSRPRNVSEVSNRESIPRHMKSVSSRFSFDMIGAAEQERLLEDRHRQKALEKKNDAVVDYDRDDDFGDDFDYEAMMDDDGLEERIPGVNTELDEEEEDYNSGYYEEEIPGVNADLDEDAEDTMIGDGHLGGFTFQQNLANPLSPYSPKTASTPRDPNGEVIGFAMSKDSPFVPAQFPGSSKPVLAPLAFDSFDSGTLGIEERLEGLGLQGINLQQSTSDQEQSPYEEEVEFPKVDGLDDDDLYFDDGIIGEADGGDAVEFDESVFDNIDTDQYGRPIRLSSLPTLYNPPTLAVDLSSSINNLVESSIATEDSLLSPVIGTLPGNLAPQTSVNFHQNPLQQAQTLTQDSLAAYQSALAEAAYRAAAEGKFRRESVSTLQAALEEENVDSRGGIHTTAEDSNLEAFSSSYDLEDDFDYDDAMEDDDFIAAANAEALANDSDGFYGQEFGFYSAPAKGAEFINGGYFGPRGVEGISRSKSGRVVSLEPNLTPITERSEYSNRNSVMGLSMNRSDIISPGLAQIAGMMREGGYEGDLSLDALMKLRRGAWGGSQASLRSSNGNASPRSAAVDGGSPVGPAPWSVTSPSQQPLHGRRNSGFTGASLVSDHSPGYLIGKGRRNSTGMAMEIGPPQSPAASLPASPTFNRSSSILNTEHGPSSPNGLPSPSSFSSMSRGGSNEGQNKSYIRKHRYTGSSDSISYLKEEDPVTGERWILERRRTAESGEIEFLGREVVSGGRI